MNLNSTQLAALKTWLDANASGLQDQEAADALNVTFSPDYKCWLGQVGKQLIDNLIDKATFTPTDSPPASGSTQQITNDQLLYQNRALVCQLKQLNAQWLILGTGFLEPKVSSVRKNFQDCLRNIPSGASGANQDGGWGPPATPGVVRLAMMRNATIGEQLFSVVATGTGNNGTDARGASTNPDNFGTGAEGLVTADNVSNARQL